MPPWCNGLALDTTDVSVGVRILSGVQVLTSKFILYEHFTHTFRPVYDGNPQEEQENELLYELLQIFKGIGGEMQEGILSRTRGKALPL